MDIYQSGTIITNLINNNKIDVRGTNLRYSIEGRITKTEGSKIFRVLHIDTNEPAVIKMVPGDETHNDKMNRQITIAHYMSKVVPDLFIPTIPQKLCFERNGVQTVAYIMDKAGDCTLHSFTNDSKYSVQNRVTVVEQAIKMVKELIVITRSRNIKFFHFDLHTSNILVDGETVDIKVIDFGRAFLYARGAVVASGNTMRRVVREVVLERAVVDRIILEMDEDIDYKSLLLSLLQRMPDSLRTTMWNDLIRRLRKTKLFTDYKKYVYHKINTPDVCTDFTASTAEEFYTGIVKNMGDEVIWLPVVVGASKVMASLL
jgi:serine/threonine protein kinase